MFLRRSCGVCRGVSARVRKRGFAALNAVAPLTRRPDPPYWASCAEGRMAAWGWGNLPLRGKSGLPKVTVPGNARAGQPDGKRHRKETAMPVMVRMKRWGKSPPRGWQQSRHGKPHQEQCQIGPPRGTGPGNGIPPLGLLWPRGVGLAALGVWQHASQRNGHLSGRATCFVDKIRLTGPPRIFIGGTQQALAAIFALIRCGGLRLRECS